VVIGSRPQRKRLLWIVGSSVALLLVIITIAVMLVWLNGEETLSDPSQKKTVVKKEAIKPVAPNESAVPFAAREYLTSPVSPGTNAMINIKTLGTAKCTIKIVYGGVASTDSGLQDKIADEYGNVSWSWTVPSEAPEGTWPIDMYCYFRDKSAYLRESLVVKKDVAH